MSHATNNAWPVLTFEDPHRMVRFLVEGLGFEEGVAIPSESDPAVILHGELWWPPGGGVMYGTAGKDQTPWGTRLPGNDAVYLVTDDPDALYQRCQDAGGTVVNEMEDTDFGSRTFSILDPEGNRWSIGTYAGTARET